MRNEKLMEQLTQLEKQMYAYNYATGKIYFDGVTVAPTGSAVGRGEALGVLTQASYQLLVNEETASLLYALREAELSDTERRRVEELIKEYERISKIPEEEYVAYQKLCNEAEHIWERAKAENNFALFAPYLEKIVEQNKRIAAYYDESKDPYDVLLDLFEEGLTQEKADRFFTALRERIVPLLAKIKDAPPVDDSFLFGNFPVEQQRELAYRLMDVLKMDQQYTGLAESEHPFTIEFNKWDVRITTKFHPESVTSSIYSTIHEGGHALYELGIADEHQYTALAGGVSMGIHESQSRFFENMIGRSKNFITYIMPMLKEIFPETFEGKTAEEVYRAVNKSEPSLIRIEADELTYALHIMVRYEIEKQLIHGELSVKDLPRVWNEKMQEYLGVAVPDDTHGVLQDVHWSGGSFGYFPSYAIGSAYAAQIYACMAQDLDIDGLVLGGNLKPIIDWLEERIFKYGKQFAPEVLLERCCGAPFDPQYYVEYLEGKFSTLYGVEL